MSVINIAGLSPVEDPMYRYKMPRLITKVEGRGNGIKTVLVNVVELATSLNREAAEITKFFGCDFGSQTTYDDKTDRAVVQGAHTAPTLQTHLSRYIEGFVLCTQCKLPETHYKIKSGLIHQKCMACGAKELVDMTHKLTTFILAQHKKSKQIESSAKCKDKDKDRKKGSKESKKGSSAAAEETPEDENGGGKTKPDKADKKPKKKKEVDSEEETEGLENKEGDEDEDMSDSKAADESIERYRLWCIENADATSETHLEELRMIQTFASMKVRDRIVFFLGANFTEAIISGNEIVHHKAMLAKLAPNQIQQRHLIASFEWFCGTRYPNLMKLFPVVLKGLFDEELVEEEVFFAWMTDSTINEHTVDGSMISYDILEQLRSSARPFITWLQQAEEEGEDDDEEEEEA